MTPLETLAQLGPIATGLAATVALVVGVATVRQRDRADQREQWWRRAQWALDLTLSDSPTRARRGFALMSYLSETSLAGGDERAMMQALEKQGLSGADPSGEDGPQTVTGGPERDDP